MLYCIAVCWPSRVCLGCYRFYFLGDDDLLEVLGQGASLAVIQPHLKKLFAGMHRVRLCSGCVQRVCCLR